MDKRTLLAIVLSVAVLLLYQMFFVKPPQPGQAPAPGTEPAKTETIAEQIVPQRVAAARKPVAGKQQPAQDVKVETPLYTAVFSTRGASLKSFKLKNYQQDCVKCADDIYPAIKRFIFGSKEQAHIKSDAPVELVSIEEGLPHPLAVTFPESSVEISAEAMFEADAASLNLLNAKEKKRLVFSGVYDGVIKVEKIFIFDPEKYTIELDVKMYNLTGAPLVQVPKLSWHQAIDPQKDFGRYDKEGPVMSVGGSIERLELKKLEKEKILGPNILWSGFESKYFIASFIPENPSLMSAIVNRGADNLISVGITGQKEIIPGRQSAVVSYSLFLGPKQHNELKELGVGLEKAIDFGIFKWLAIPFLLFLNFLYTFIPNYGVAIIVLTILIKLIFWPLGNISYKSMKEMQKIQPKINELRQKYKNDQAKLGQETMALYRSHKINPLSGCLPILIQLPVFIGLFNALLYAIELRHSPLFFWIQDLSAKDPYYITPILMGITQFIQQKMTPTMGDPMMAKMMLFMPVVLTIFFLNFPSGLVIYWLFNNILSIGQQFYINKKLAN
ncbi:MAG TPA: membrane protein insertase YidC [Smithellaceae bacterium]|nr:membrane protein insertase YidC [Smithellaceae bacterium]HRS88900.1 membrane protein insertase YidC [Smithellaceae bacterium]HRV26239.1 membrane protein insertase YidC [Smithellaceae bacterium]